MLYNVVRDLLSDGFVHFGSEPKKTVDLGALFF